MTLKPSSLKMREKRKEYSMTINAQNQIINNMINDVINVKYPNIVFANKRNAYIKKAYRKSKLYREAIFVKFVIFGDIDNEFGYNMAEVKKVCREEGLSISAVKAGLNHFGQKAFDFLIVGQLPPIPSTREVIRIIKSKEKYFPQDDEEILF
jgi:hypothetical protein